MPSKTAAGARVQRLTKDVIVATVSILVADDHAIFRRGLRTLLETQPTWKVVAEVSNGREAVDQAARLRPDIAILDIGMPELNGLDAAILILKASPRTRIL